MGIRHLSAVVLVGACTSTGPSGSAGANSLIFTTDEPPGTNCPAGGLRLDHGADLDGNGLLTANEVTGTGFVCDGPQGTMGGMGNIGRQALVDVEDEAMGSNCPAGGRRIDYGVDDDADGVLESGEIDGSTYVCHGATGAAGRQSLIAVTSASGAQCANGGHVIAHGVDDDSDAVLESGEVDGTSTVCNGATPTAELAALDARATALEQRRLHSATITNGTNPVVVRSSGGWISSTTHPAYGSIVVNFVSGTFSGVPTCVANLVSYPGGSAAGSISITDTTATSVTLMTVCTGSTCTGQWDVTFNLLCAPF